ncbi:MAG: HU family DNA-binding protein [Bacteroides sp.]|nr:HU family DNA-binding protein [Bacteroides sp.]
MDTRQLAQHFADRAGIQAKEATRMIEALGSTIAGMCCNLDTVAIPGFGNFSAAKHDEYVATDPESGERKLVPPAIVPEFRTSVVLRNRLSR